MADKICMVCGKRRGREVFARYRLASETKPDDPAHNYDVLKKIRPLIICRFCMNKAAMTGYFSNSRIYIDRIYEAEKLPVPIVTAQPSLDLDLSQTIQHWNLWK